LSTSWFVEGAGRWLLDSGIQEANGGVARFYRSDIGRNHSISMEITGYAVSTLVYLHALTGRQRFLDRAVLAARFLVRTAWDEGCGSFPFEPGAPLAYFFDSGIIVRGLLAAWRATGDVEFRDAAERCGRAMLRDFAAGDEFHPILTLPDKCPAPRDARWSRSTGCYQSKAALAWHDLAEATADSDFEAPYSRMVDFSLGTGGQFLPGESDGAKVMDRLHAYAYFLEGLLPGVGDVRSAAALREGIDRLAGYLEELAGQFERSDVYAQLLRLRLFADWAGVLPVDQEAAAFEAAQLAGFQRHHSDRRIDGGFCFGRKGRQWLPYMNPVSTGFGLQALAMWQQHLAGEPRTDLRMLI
jgi:hypothetical protein